jgi:hypothetical protein
MASRDYRSANVFSIREAYPDPPVIGALSVQLAGD